VLTDVEISRALNAVSTTLREQRPESFDPARVREIAVGALGGEPKIDVRAGGHCGGELRSSEDGRLLATVERRRGEWIVERKVSAGGSDWALPGSGAAAGG
jgi:hypothetical protein